MRDVAYDAPLDQPPREQVESAEAKLHELLEGAPGTHSERRTIGDAASGAAASIEKPTRLMARSWGSLWASRP